MHVYGYICVQCVIKTYLLSLDLNPYTSYARELSGRITCAHIIKQIYTNKSKCGRAPAHMHIHAKKSENIFLYLTKAHCT
jgi:hypothetical protein